MQKKTTLAMRLLLGAISLSLSGCVFGSKEKKAEELEDPLKTKTEYYIVGKVITAEGVVANADVKISDAVKIKTDAEGKYSFTIDKAGDYTLTFSAAGLEELKVTTRIAPSTANRSMVTLNVKMVKATAYTPPVTVDTENETIVSVPGTGESPEEAPATVMVIPAGATEEGTTVSAGAYEEPAAVEAPSTPTSEKKETIHAAISNVSIKTEPTDTKAKQDIIIGTPNTVSTTNNYFSPEGLVAMKDGAATKAWENIGSVTYNNDKKQYEITIPKGTRISGKYSTRVIADKITSKETINEFNKVNGKETLEVDNAGNLSGIKDYEIKIEAKAGWEYTTDPVAALKAQGASDELAPLIKKQIEAGEGAIGFYTISYTLKTNISGNSIMFYQNKAKFCTKTYTFKVAVNGTAKNVKVILKCYTGTQEKYTNTTANQHSGGKG